MDRKKLVRILTIATAAILLILICAIVILNVIPTGQIPLPAGL